MIELRDAGPNHWSASGWATTWSHFPERGVTFVHDPRRGMFLERVARNAFSDATSGRDSVELRLEHNPGGPGFASTSMKTMAFTDERDGLLMAAALSKSDPSTQLAVADIREGRLTGLSVGMIVRRDPGAPRPTDELPLGRSRGRPCPRRRSSPGRQTRRRSCSTCATRRAAAIGSNIDRCLAAAAGDRRRRVADDVPGVRLPHDLPRVWVLRAPRPGRRPLRGSPELHGQRGGAAREEGPGRLDGRTLGPS
ncbi:MAG: HK97 family phage prohead protease [Chloroflexi bacterium]|nr:HK97 family phage prohead protease [Chloroflexota bacterium]